MSHSTKVGMISVVLFLVVTAVLARSVIGMKGRQNMRLQARQNIVCPSFLSIARSARDTLIVMRNEPLCNRYVLDNLK